jgi:hypothetical protein
MSTEMPSPQECKAKAIILIRDSSNLHDLTEQSVMVQAAQVWATLATVPEPLEELTAVAPTWVGGPTIEQPPVLVCPHGYQARIDTIEAEGRPVQLRYTWHDCPSPSCP